MIEKQTAQVYIVKGADNEFQAAKKVLDGKDYLPDSIEKQKPFVYSAKTGCEEYQWVFYVEEFLGEYRVTEIFEKI